jgi:hypothetical protein
MAALSTMRDVTGIEDLYAQSTHEISMRAPLSAGIDTFPT